MTTALVLGTLAAFLATTLAAALRRAPTRTRCPECGGATVGIVPEAWLLRRVPNVRLRWCQACSWEGWATHDAPWIQGPPPTHDSGFAWGEERLPEDFGFHFGTPSSPTRDARSVRRRQGPPPAGFAWKRLPAEGDRRSDGR
ncbi:MAG TPA: hypothetical protein VLA36_15115 [Longimicrobiales bacterium]|nr:hypothetical protein [Longimicrobiales bacterium]